MAYDDTPIRICIFGVLSTRIIYVETVWGWPLLVPRCLHTSAQSQVHKDVDEQVWCGGLA